MLTVLRNPFEIMATAIPPSKASTLGIRGLCAGTVSYGDSEGERRTERGGEDSDSLKGGFMTFMASRKHFTANSLLGGFRQTIILVVSMNNQEADGRF